MPASGGIAKHDEVYQTKYSSQGTILYSAKTLRPDLNASKPRMATGPSNAYYAWLSPPDALTVIPELFFSSSTVSPKPLSAIELSPIPAWNADIALDKAEQVYVAWSEGTEGARRIYMRRSSDQGANFSATRRVSDLATDSDVPLMVGESSGIVNVVWVADPGTGERYIGFARTEDGGLNFSPPLRLSANGTDAQCPQIGADDNGRVYVAWQGTDKSTFETRIHLITSQANLTFTETMPPVGQNQPGCPRMSIRKQGGAYFTWEEEGEIYFIRFVPGRTNNPTQGVRVSTNSAGILSGNPQIALDGTAINIVWEEGAAGSRKIYFSGSKNGGTLFSDPINLSLSASEAVSPAIQSDGAGQVGVAWAQGPAGAKDIYSLAGPGARGLPAPFASDTYNHRDVNGDGIDDFIVGAPSDFSGAPGKAYLYFGESASPMTPNVTAFHGFLPTEQNIPAQDRFGAAVALGDINGDDYADILVGAPEYGNGKGAVYIFFGPLPKPDQPDVVIKGEQAQSLLGAALSSAGDVNGDGAEDLIIGAPSASGNSQDSGQVFLFLGGNLLKAKAGGDPASLSAAAADQIYSGEQDSVQFGFSVSGVGDLNADGYADFAAGSPYEDNDQGAVYLFDGGVNLPLNARKILQGDPDDQLGFSVAGIGDVDGDGFSDFLAGAPYRSATLYFGGDPLNDPRILTLDNPESDTGNGFGVTLSGHGDVNGDTFDDILVGAPFATNGGDLTVGKVFVYLGSSQMNGTPDRVFIGEQPFYKLGNAGVRIAGDVNDDGLNDIIVGAPLWDGTAADQGKTYLFLGSKDWTETGGTPIAPVGTADLELNGTAANDHFGGSLWRK